MPDDPLTAAVDEANEAIRDFLRALPKHAHLWTDAQRERYDVLLAAWGDAVRRQARAREGEQDPAPVAA